MSGFETHVEAVAQAIADNLTSQAEVADVPDRYVDWIDPDELAAAAVNALGLTEEVQERPVANGQPCTCNRPDGKHYGMGCDIRRTDWIPHSRLVSPWVVQQEGETDE